MPASVHEQARLSVLQSPAESMYKRSELLLMRRARAYGSSCSQVILVYLHPFRRNSLFCSQKSPKDYFKSIF